MSGRTNFDALRAQVLERDGWTCQFCGRQRELHVHHVHPRGRGGKDTEENLVTLCALCHRSIHDHRMSSYPSALDDTRNEDPDDRGTAAPESQQKGSENGDSVRAADEPGGVRCAQS
jgi:hypothetical protein